ncbi:MAG TPA: hypothetical protein VHO03_13535 [Ignavibacteriales bacterium]|nr:hypothetical protein [Ignavibacteriales bacterium]
MENLLKKYNYFDDCYLKEIKWSNNFIGLDIIIDYIWEGKKVRKNLDEEKLIKLSFSHVQKFIFYNNLDSNFFKYEDEIGWGFNNFSIIKLENNSEMLAPYLGFPRKFNHLSILWESERRIDIVFGDLEAIELF